ncbi:protein retinal degeneration B-like [Clytia hemisphaerica]|uniref:DDHD domain-containing protein n=1 Tax=Clytia hemisphaerica TaxID=252671 RepID=A0A7M5XHP4_9CNID
MLTKEYRIPLPLSLEEYRIAQLYMIQKKSRLESTGSGSSVEIIENRPYKNGPGGNGQYTKKIYHIGSHLPGWLKALLPKTALRVEEEAWNAYPYTKTRHTCPFIEKFFIDIETHYLADYGQTENIFELSSSERKNIEIDLIDPIKDTFPQKDYKKEEDPVLFVSAKTGRGPLRDDWLQGYIDGTNKSPVMCAYKLIKVEFKYWGMQSKIENFIQSGLRNPMLVGHRQAWSWQDEWHGLTIEDIRELEKEAQEELSKRMDAIDNNSCQENHQATNTDNNNHSESNGNTTSESIDSQTSKDPSCGASTPSPISTTESVPFSNNHRHSSIHTITNQERLLEIHMKHIEQLESDEADDSEGDSLSLYYDALDYFDDPSDTPIHHASTSTLTKNNIHQQVNGEPPIGVTRPKIPSEPIVVSPTINISHENQFIYKARVQTLVFVIQGGSVSDYVIDTESRMRDFQTFERLFTKTCNTCYPGARERVFFEVIECMSLTKGIMKQLLELNVESRKGPLKTDDFENLSNTFPFSAIPLLMFHHPDFQLVCNSLVDMINQKYEQLQGILNEDRHEVYFLCDSVGGLFVFQALCQYSNRDDISSSSSTFDEEDDKISIDSGILRSTLNFRFTTNGVFTLGSPIGMVALKQKISSLDKDFSQPRCGQLYNLFHSFDPISSRIEPIIDENFANVRPAPVPRCNAFPFNDDIQYNASSLFLDPNLNLNDEPDVSDSNSLRSHALLDRKVSSTSVSSNARKSAYNDKAFYSSWWGTKRIDYMTHSPEGLQQFPVSTLIQLCYNSYWESKDIVTFIVWQILQEIYSHIQSPSNCLEVDRSIALDYLQLPPCEKWTHKRTALKVKNLNPNHRANDVCSMSGAQHYITGKFAYGPVDMAALKEEKVDIYYSRRPQLNEWKHFGTDTTDSNGRLVYTLPSRDIECGVYNVKMVVRGDHSSVGCNMAVLPPQTEAVVFSIDGSFLASYSIRGVDPKIRGGAVDVVRHWQELGYLIIYVSSRLLFQKHQVMSWLAAHNFPFGIVSFGENVSKDYQKHKLEFLKNICKFEKVFIHAAYGSSRDISIYSNSLKLSQQRIFILGKKPKSKKADNVQWITDGYKNHLSELQEGLYSARRSANKKFFAALGNFEKVSTRKGTRMKKKSLEERLSGEKPEKKEKKSLMKSFRNKPSKHEKNKES